MAGRPVLTRWLGLAALAALALGTVGCGGTAVSDVAEAADDQLTVYSSLPLSGPEAPISEQVVNGERLALADAGGRAGSFKIAFSSLNDASPKTGEWSPGVTSTDAKIAAQDTSTIAYIGDLDSGATAISLPVTNAAGILQLSPASPYVGLTSSFDAGQDEPERFYLTGKRTFARLQGGDIVQARTQVLLMQSLGLHRVYVLYDDEDPFEVPLAEIVAGDAERADIDVLGRESVSIRPRAKFKGEVQKILEAKPEAVFVAGGSQEGAATLWRELHAADAHLTLLGAASLLSPAFATEAGEIGDSAYLTDPVLPTDMYPPSAARVLADYRRTFDAEGNAYALYGYEAMTLVLDAVRSAGARGDNRQTVIDRVFATRERNSVIGRYSIEADGDTTLSRYGVERVRNGHLVFYRAFDVSQHAAP